MIVLSICWLTSVVVGSFYISRWYYLYNILQLLYICMNYGTIASAVLQWSCLIIWKTRGLKFILNCVPNVKRFEFSLQTHRKNAVVQYIIRLIRFGSWNTRVDQWVGTWLFLRMKHSYFLTKNFFLILWSIPSDRICESSQNRCIFELWFHRWS